MAESCHFCFTYTTPISSMNTPTKKHEKSYELNSAIK